MNQRYAMIVTGDFSDADYITKFVDLGETLTEQHKLIARDLLNIKNIDCDVYGDRDLLEMFKCLSNGLQDDIIANLIREEGAERYNKYGDDWKREWIFDYLPHHENPKIHTVTEVRLIQYNNL